MLGIIYLILCMLTGMEMAGCLFPHQTTERGNQDMGGPAGSVWDGNPDADLGSLYSFLDVQRMRGGRASSFLWKSDR